MRKRRVTLQLISILCIILLVAGVSCAYASATQTLNEIEERAAEMIFQAFDSNDAKEQETLLLQAVQTAPDSPPILLECANLLSILNVDGKLTDTIEQILLQSKSIAEGKLRIQTLQALGDHYLQTQGIEATRLYIEDELEKTPQDITLLIMLAKVCYYGDQTDRAISILDTILEDSPDVLEAANLRAVLLCQLKRWDEAIDAFNQIEKKFPYAPEGLYGRYLAYNAAGQFDLAIRAINDEIFYRREEYLWMERLNIRLLRQHDPETALTEAEAFVKAQPNWLDAYIAQLNALIMMDRYDEAIDVAKGVSEIDEEVSKLLEGLVLLNASRWDEAKELIIPALSIPALQVFWADAARLYTQGYDDIDSATDAIIQSFAVPDNEFLSFLRLGDLNKHVGDLLEAARCYYRAEQYATGDAQAMQALVLTLIDAGRRDDAEKYLSMMEERYPGWYETMFARIVFEDVFSMPEEALISFVAFQEKFPFEASRMQPIEAVLLLATGNLKGEKIIAEWMNKQNPEALTISHWLQYAEALIYTENTEKIADALDMAESYLYQIDPSHINQIRQYQSVLSAHRAELARLSGDMESCVQWLEKAAALGTVLLSDTLETPDGNPYHSEAYNELYEAYSSDDQPWDITVLPKIPR